MHLRYEVFVYHLLRRSLRAAVAAVPLLLISLAGFAQTDSIEEIVITGKGAGPPLWHVHNGDNQLIIFGQHAPLPKKLEWDSTRVENVLRDADAYLPTFSVRSGEGWPGPIRMFRLVRRVSNMRELEDERTLDTALPPDLLREVQRLKDRYGPRGSDFFRLRPFLAAEALLEAMLDKAGLAGNSAIDKRISHLVRKYDVPTMSAELVTTARYEEMLDSIDEISFDSEIACLAAVVRTLEVDVETLQDLALAWAYGQVGALHDIDRHASQTCLDALTEGALAKQLVLDARDLWMNQAHTALHTKHLTFAVLPIGELLRPDGLLAKLEDEGFEVIRP